MPELPIGTVTFLFTDLEGSTRLWEQYPDAMRDALARHDEILRDAVEKRGGHVVKTTGDGLHAVFASAADGVTAAVDAQRALVVEPWRLSEPLRVRMGLHAGTAELRDGDYYGAAVNRAARISAAAHGGQIVASAAVADLAPDDLDPTIELTDLGEHRFRDLGRPERVYGVVGPDLPVDFPDLRTLDAYPGNLPQQRTTFVGRAREVGELRDALHEASLVTLTGVAGVGKTRLAIQAAALAVVDHPDGAWLVELAPVTSGDDVAATVAGALQLRDRADPVRAVAAALRHKRALIVLDNCEHVVDDVAELVDALSGLCPELTILATSREALGVDGELVYALRPLGTVTADDDQIAVGDAVQLFADRARAVDRDFVVSADNSRSVAELCRRLDGIPLAIELAAARVQLMSPDEILDKLDERLRLLSSGRRRSLERHQTLFAAIEWSYNLLREQEQRLFARLSVFSGGFTLDAAEAIANLHETSSQVIDVLGDLVRRSMVTVTSTSRGTRYDILETLRLYGHERLQELGEAEATRRLHAEFQTALARSAQPHLTTPAEVDWVVRVRAEADNQRAALQWLRDQQDVASLVDLVDALFPVWERVLAARDAVTWASFALSHDDQYEPERRSFLLTIVGWACNVLGRPSDSRRALQASIDCARQHGHPIIPRAASMLGVIELESNHGDAAIALAEQGRAAAEERGEEHATVETSVFLMLVLTMAGDADRAARMSDDVVTRARQLGAPSLLGYALFTAGTTRLMRGDPSGAIAFLERSHELYESLGRGDGQPLMFLALAKLQLGLPAEAASSLRAALPRFVQADQSFFVSTTISAATVVLARFDRTTAVMLLAALERYQDESAIAGAPRDLDARKRVRARLERDLTADEFAAAWAVGIEMSLDQAATIADDALAALEAT